MLQWSQSKLPAVEGNDGDARDWVCGSSRWRLHRDGECAMTRSAEHLASPELSSLRYPGPPTRGALVTEDSHHSGWRLLCMGCVEGQGHQALCNRHSDSPTPWRTGKVAIWPRHRRDPATNWPRGASSASTAGKVRLTPQVIWLAWMRTAAREFPGRRRAPSRRECRASPPPAGPGRQQRREYR